jgi:hypothetical protein
MGGSYDSNELAWLNLFVSCTWLTIVSFCLELDYHCH